MDDGKASMATVLKTNSRAGNGRTRGSVLQANFSHFLIKRMEACLTNGELRHEKKGSRRRRSSSRAKSTETALTGCCLVDKGRRQIDQDCCVSPASGRLDASLKYCWLRASLHIQLGLDIRSDYLRPRRPGTMEPCDSPCDSAQRLRIVFHRPERLPRTGVPV